MAMIASVNRILFRRSATLNMFRRLESTSVPLGGVDRPEKRPVACEPVLPVTDTGAQSRPGDLDDYLVTAGLAVRELISLRGRTAVPPRQRQHLDGAPGLRD